jgi:hypothetical protein
VGFDDLIDIRSGDAAVPNGVGIDHHVRPVLALIETPGFVSADAVLIPENRQFLLKSQLELRLPCRIAATARMSLRPLIAAHKDVSFELRHKSNLQEKLARDGDEMLIVTGSREHLGKPV